MAQNLDYWDELAAIHSRGDRYPVKEVIRGETTLRTVELDILGAASGQHLLHSHCHIGLDSVSLARLGFQVIGIDYSATAIKHAQNIAKAAGVANCSFKVSNSIDPAVPAMLNAFDIYYASYGVLVWVPDVDVWFKSASSYLKPGGTLILIDEHPFAATLDGAVASSLPPVSAPYWQDLGPYSTRNNKSYSGDHDLLTNDVQIKWPHSIGDILNAAIDAGFRIVRFSEYPFSHYRSVPQMKIGKDSYYHHPYWVKSVPFLFALELVKAGS